MEIENFIQLPVMPPEPGSYEYFWFQLPYALPGFFTFIISIFLIVVCIQAYLYRSRKSDYIIYTGLFLSYGVLALILGLRATIQSQELLTRIHSFIYWMVIPLYPISVKTLILITGDRIKSINYHYYLGVAISFGAIVSLALGMGFTGNWLEYPFGIYPEGGILLKIWGGVGGFSAAYCYTFTYLRMKKERWEDINPHLYYGLLLLLVLLLSNFPSLAGYSVYPLGMFFFIPMLIIAYGLFRDDILDLRTLILERRVGFYATAFIIVSILFLMTYFFATKIKPEEAIAHYNPYLLIPLLSLFCIFALSAYIAGVNPSSPMHLYVAGLLLTTGFLQIIGILRTIDYEPIVLYRIEQMLYFFFILLPSLNTRFIFTVFRKEFNYKVYLIDYSSVILAILTQTPYLFDGYFLHEFGRTPKSGPALYGFMVVGLTSIGFMVSEWFKIPGSERTPFQIRTFLSIGLSNIFVLFNAPAVLGYPVYPLGNLQFIPVVLIGYSLLRDGEMRTMGDANKITTRYTKFLLFLSLIVIFLYWNSLPGEIDFLQKLLHISVVWTFFFLANFVSSFVVIRPIAGILDSNYLKLVESTNELEQSKILKERSLLELEKLNNLQMKINSTMDMDYLFREVSTFFKDLYNVYDSWILFIDEEKNQVYTGWLDIYNSVGRSQENIDWTMNFRTNLTPEIGSLHRVYTSQKFLYTPERVIKRAQSPLDIEIIKRMDLSSTLHYPIIVNGKTIGIYCLNLDPKNIPTRNEMMMIQSFILILSGSIQRTLLYRKSSDERLRQARIAEEIKSISQLNRLIIQNNDIVTIMNYVMEYIRITIGLDAYHSLYKLDSSGRFLTLISTDPPVHISEEDKNKLYNTKIDVNLPGSFHGKVIKSKKVVYFNNIDKRFKGQSFEEWVVSISKLKNFLMIPLLIDDIVIAILDLSYKQGDDWTVNSELKGKLGRLGIQISAAIDKSVNYQEQVLAKKEQDDLVQYLSILNKTSNDFNQEIDLNSLFDKLEVNLSERFQINQYGIAIVTKNKKNAYFKYTNLYKTMSKSKRRVIDDCVIDLSDNISGHTMAFKYKKSLLVHNAKDRNIATSEREVISELKVSTLLIIPLIVKNEVIGFLDIYDKGKLELTKKEREYLEEFSNLIASALWNSILLDDLKKAYEDLKSSQEQLIQSEKMAALGQLVSGVAHEINTPLGAIKASIGNIVVGLRETLDELPKFIKELPREEWEMVQDAIGSAKIQNSILTTKEQRQLRKDLTSQLDAKGVENSEEIAEFMVDIGIAEVDDAHIQLWKHSKRSDIIRLIYNISGFQNKVSIIQDAVNKAAKIVQALKNYAHFGDSEVKQKANVIDGLETVLIIYQNSLKKGIEIEKVYGDIPEILCYPDELNQVWTNIIHNAIQAMENKGKITIRTGLDESRGNVNVEIEDNGPGIPPDIQEKIFKAFFTTKGRGEGSGLGLHITRKIIQKHKGQIHLESKPGRTIFKISLPVHFVPELELETAR